jgi:hypothetical protein
MAAVRALLAPRRAVRNTRIASMIPSRRLGPRSRPGQRGPGGRLGVDRVRLAMLPAGSPVGPVGLDHPHLLIEQVASQAGAVAAGALHPDHTDLSVVAKPAQQLLVAATIS